MDRWNSSRENSTGCTSRLYLFLVNTRWRAGLAEKIAKGVYLLGVPFFGESNVEGHASGQDSTGVPLSRAYLFLGQENGGTRFCASSWGLVLPCRGETFESYVPRLPVYLECDTPVCCNLLVDGGGGGFGPNVVNSGSTGVLGDHRQTIVVVEIQQMRSGQVP